MTSVYRQALGDEFDDLHPKIRERYAIDGDAERACVGQGEMNSVSCNPLAVPVLLATARRNVMFPEQGTDVPFVVRNYAYVDGAGRETLAFLREFDLDRRRGRFDATMVYSEERECVVDYLGTHGDVAADLHPTVEDGGLIIRAGEQRLRVGNTGRRIPRPLSAAVTVEERYDDSSDRFTISVEVTNPLVGRVFEYDGHFTVTYENCPSVPSAVVRNRPEGD